MDQILSLYEARSLGKYLTKIFYFIKGQYLAQIKIQIVIQIGYVDAALLCVIGSERFNGNKQTLNEESSSFLGRYLSGHAQAAAAAT